MPRYRYLSDALNEVLRERALVTKPGTAQPTPIFQRVMGRRGPVRFPHDFTGWSKPMLRGYIDHWHPARPDTSRFNKRSLTRLAEQVRDWQGFDSEYPSDEDLIVPFQMWKLEHRFTGARLLKNSLDSVNGDAEE